MATGTRGRRPVVAHGVALALMAACNGPGAARVAADPSLPEAGALLPPFAAAGADFQVVWGSTTCLDGDATYHPQGSAYVLRWSQLDGPAVTLSDPTARAPCFVAPLGDADMHFSLAADDGRFVVSHTVLVQARQAALVAAPQAAGGPDRFAGDVSDALASGRDLQPTPPDVAAHWQAVQPAPSALLGPAGASATAQVFRLVASRGGLLAAPDYILIWPPDAGIGVPAPPRVAVAAPAQVAPGASFALTVSAPGGGALAEPMRLHWTQLCGEPVLGAAGDDPELTLTAPRRAQTLCFRVTGRDALLESAPADAVIAVAAADGSAPPQVAPPVLAVHAGNLVTVVADVSQPLGAPGVAYAWRQTAGPQVPLSATGAQQVIAAPAAGSTLAIEVFGSVPAVDGAIGVAIVQSVPASQNRPPQVSLCASPATAAAGATVLLYATVQDPDQDPPGPQTFTPPPGDAAPTPVVPPPALPPAGCAAAVPLGGVLPQAVAASLVAPMVPSSISVLFTACDAYGACNAAEAAITVPSP